MSYNIYTLMHNNVCEFIYILIVEWYEHGRNGRICKYLQVQLFIVRIPTVHVNRDTWLWFLRNNYG